MKRSAERLFYHWTRDLHLYLALLISPFVITFAISVLFLNHAKVDTAFPRPCRLFATWEYLQRLR